MSSLGVTYYQEGEVLQPLNKIYKMRDKERRTETRSTQNKGVQWSVEEMERWVGTWASWQNEALSSTHDIFQISNAWSTL